MRTAIVVLVALLLSLSGCGQSKADHIVWNHTSGDPVHHVGKNQMPKTMPKDFEFAIHYGVGGKNSVNTFNHTVTKDLVGDTATIDDFHFTKQEKEKIYHKMREVNVMVDKNLVYNKRCGQVPYDFYSLKVQVKGKIKEFHWSNQNCGMTKDGHQLKNVIDLIRKIVEKKPAYQQLPETKGAYS